jgi:hypothetical protein
VLARALEKIVEEILALRIQRQQAQAKLDALGLLIYRPALSRIRTNNCAGCDVRLGHSPRRQPVFLCADGIGAFVDALLMARQ